MRLTRANIKMPPGLEVLQGTFDTLMRYIDLSSRSGPNLVYFPGGGDKFPPQLGPSNSTAETTFWSVDLPSAELPEFASARVTLSGQVLNNSGANRNVTLRIKILGVTVWKTVLTISASAAMRTWEFDLLLYRSFVSQAGYHLTGHCMVSGPNAVADAGTSDLGGFDTAVDSNTSASVAAIYANDVDTYADPLNLLLSAQFSAASASLAWTTIFAQTELWL